MDSDGITKAEEMRATNFVSDMLVKLPLISDYNQRPMVNEMYRERSEALRKVFLPATTKNFNNSFVPAMMGPFMIVIYTAIGAHFVLNGSITVGVYLATISVFG